MKVRAHINVLAIVGLVVSIDFLGMAACASDSGGGSDDDPCGDGVCQASETAASCPADCRPMSQCGDHVCASDETVASCPQDCTCGDGVCASSETEASCPQDCTATVITQNNSSFAVNHLYLYSCTSPTEGADQLNGGTIALGSSFTLSKLSPGCYHFHATTFDGSGWGPSPAFELAAAHIYTLRLNN